MTPVNRTTNRSLRQRSSTSSPHSAGRVTQSLLAGVALVGVAEVPILVAMGAPMEAYPTVGGAALAALSIIELVRRRPA